MAQRAAANFYVLPPDYLTLYLWRRDRIVSNSPAVPIAENATAGRFGGMAGSCVAVHRLGLNLSDIYDPFIYIGSLKPDKYTTTPIYIGAVANGLLRRMAFMVEGVDTPQSPLKDLMQTVVGASASAIGEITTPHPPGIW